jgi:hypothetical protein
MRYISICIMRSFADSFLVFPRYNPHPSKNPRVRHPPSICDCAEVMINGLESSFLRLPGRTWWRWRRGFFRRR